MSILFILFYSALAFDVATLRSRFYEWKTKFQKEYQNHTHEAVHFKSWVENWIFVEAHNAIKSVLVLEMNKFADLNREQWREWRKAKGLILPLGWNSSLPRTTHNSKFVSNPFENPNHKITRRDGQSSVDWVTAGAVTSVKSQGGCGSCWAFSAVGAAEGLETLFGSGKLYSFSEQQLVDCATEYYGNNGCSGGLMDNAFRYLMKEGLCLSSDYPYLGYQSTCMWNYCKDNGDTMSLLKGYTDVKNYYDNELMSALNSRPVSVAVDASGSYFQLYSSGVLATEQCGASLDHGVLAVGYGVSSAGTAYYRVKNSWGQSWGNSGYIYLERSTNSQANYGTCGILTLSSYPTF